MGDSLKHISVRVSLFTLLRQARPDYTGHWVLASPPGICVTALRLFLSKCEEVGSVGACLLGEQLPSPAVSHVLGAPGRGVRLGLRARSPLLRLAQPGRTAVHEVP